MDIYKNKKIGKTILELNRDELVLIQYLLEKNAQKVSKKIEHPLSAQLFEKISNYNFEDAIDSDDSTGLPF